MRSREENRANAVDACRSAQCTCRGCQRNAAGALTESAPLPAPISTLRMRASSVYSGAVDARQKGTPSTHGTSAVVANAGRISEGGVQPTILGSRWPDPSPARPCSAISQIVSSWRGPVRTMHACISLLSASGVRYRPCTCAWRPCDVRVRVGEVTKRARERGSVSGLSGASSFHVLRATTSTPCCE